MKRIFYNFFFSLLLIATFFDGIAQINQFQISKTYFEGHSIRMISENRGGMVILLDDNSLFLMNKKMEFKEITSLFKTEILIDATCVEMINERCFFLGTNQNSLHKYEDGEVIDLRVLNPNLPLQINSIDFAPFYYESTLLVATNDNNWSSNDLKNFSKYESSYTKYSKFYSTRYAQLLSEYPFCTEVPGQYGLMTHTANGTILYRILENEGFTIDGLHDVILAKAGYGSGGYNTYAHYATDNGIYTQHIYSCSIDTFVHFRNRAVYDLQTYSSNAGGYYLLAATSDGLFFTESNGSYLKANKPEYFKVDGIDSANLIIYNSYFDLLLVGTNNGLVQMASDLEREIISPQSVVIDTVLFCEDVGIVLDAKNDSRLDFQWYLNGEKIDGAFSNSLKINEEGIYSLKYFLENDSFQEDVVVAKLDTVFRERIEPQTFVICQDQFNPHIEIENFNYYNHEYSWYSVERGLEASIGNQTPYFQFKKPGHYYFVSTNCNGFTYTSDTVEVLQSLLEKPYFINFKSGNNVCISDSLYLGGSDHASEISWKVDGTLLKNSKENFLPVKEMSSYEYIYVTTKDELGCTFNLNGSVRNILPEPEMSPDQLHQLICDSSEFIYFEIPNGSTLYIDGTENYYYQELVSGIYDIKVSNGVCTDFNAQLVVEDFNPYPDWEIDYLYVPSGDTIKIPITHQYEMSWIWPFKKSKDGNYIYVTSSSEFNAYAEFNVHTPYCTKTYQFEISFGIPLSSKNEQNDLSIYPNPTQKSVFFKSQFNDQVQVYLTDLQGTVLLSDNIILKEGAELQLPENIVPGTYLLHISRNNSEPVVKKLLVY